MTDIDPTPSTPVTIGDRLAWWREELRQALVDLRSDENHSLRGIANAITLAYMNIQGTQNKTLTHVDDRLATLQDTVYDGLYIQGEVANYPAHIRLNAELVSISERLDYIQAALGAQPYESLELASVRGLLQAILINASASTYGLAPITTGSDVSSDGDVYLEGRLYAFFGEPPDATVNLNEAGIVLTASNWSGWSCYIQTADPEPRENSDPAPANRWYNLVGTGSKSWSVKQQHTIRLTLRKPVVAGSVVLTSQLITRNDGYNLQRVDLTPVSSWFNVSPNPNVTANSRTFPLPVYFAPNQAVSLRYVAGPVVRVWRYNSNGQPTLVGNLPSIATTYTYNDWIVCQPGSDTINLATTFSIEVYNT